MRFVTVITARRRGNMRKCCRSPIRIGVVTGSALRVVCLCMERVVRPGFVSVTTDACARKRRMQRDGIGKCPVVHDVAAGTVPKPCARLMRRSRGPQIAVASVAHVWDGSVEEISWWPTRILMVTAGALCLKDLGVEVRWLSRLVLVTSQAGCWKRRVERRRVGCGPVGDDMAGGAIALARRGLVRGRVGSPIAVTI